MASSGKGLKIFRDEKGEPYRATDSVGPEGSRVQVPLPEQFRKAKDNFGALVSGIAQTGKITSSMIHAALTDKDFRQRLGLLVGMPLAKHLKDLSDKVAKDGRISQFFDTWINEAQAKLADQYGDDKDPFAQAIRKGDGLRPKPNTSFQEKMEFYVARYNLYAEALKKPEKYIKPAMAKETVGKMTAAAIPFAVGLAISAGFGIALPLIMGEELMSVLAGFGLSELMDLGVQKGLDKAKVDNQWIRFAASMATGIFAGGIVTLASKKMGGKSLQEATKKAATQKVVEGEDIILKTKKAMIDAGKNIDPDPLAAKMFKEMGIEDVELTLQTKSVNQDYSTRTVFNSKEQPPMEPSAHELLSKGMMSQEFADIINHLDTDHANTVIARHSGRIYIYRTRIPTQRMDNRGRRIGHTILLSFTDTPEGEKAARRFAAASLKNKLSDLDHAVDAHFKGKDYITWSVDQGKYAEILNRIVKEEKAEDGVVSKVSKAIEFASDTIRHESELFMSDTIPHESEETQAFVKELRKTKLPDHDGILVLASHELPLGKKAREAKIWRTFAASPRS